MGTYRIEQHDKYNSFGDFVHREYVIKEKKFLFGWCWRHAVTELDELKFVFANLKAEGNIVYFHWSFTDRYKMMSK